MSPEVKCFRTASPVVPGLAPIDFLKSLAPFKLGTVAMEKYLFFDGGHMRIHIFFLSSMHHSTAAPYSHVAKNKIKIVGDRVLIDIFSRSHVIRQVVI